MVLHVNNSTNCHKIMHTHCNTHRKGNGVSFIELKQTKALAKASIFIIPKLFLICNSLIFVTLIMIYFRINFSMICIDPVILLLSVHL